VRALRSLLGLSASDQPDDAHLGLCVALAYPERIAQQRTAPGRYRLRNGAGAVLPGHGNLWRCEFLAVADLDGKPPDAAILLAAPLERDVLETIFDDEISTHDVLHWEASSGTIVASRQSRLGALVLRETTLTDPDPDAVMHALLTAIREGDGITLRWSDAAQQLRARVAFLRSRDPRWPDWSDHALLASLESWLSPRLVGIRRRDQVEKLPLDDALLDTLDWDMRRDLDQLAPTHVAVPTGSRIRIDYSQADTPRIAVRLQEMFGLEQTPTIANGDVRSPSSCCHLRSGPCK